MHCRHFLTLCKILESRLGFSTFFFSFFLFMNDLKNLLVLYTSTKSRYIPGITSEIFFQKFSTEFYGKPFRDFIRFLGGFAEDFLIISLEISLRIPPGVSRNKYFGDFSKNLQLNNSVNFSNDSCRKFTQIS